MPSSTEPVMYPPKIPTTSNKAVSNGKLTSAAAILGLTRNRMGFISMVSRASICSEIRMIPISAAMAADKAAALATIAEEARACTACLLHGSRQQAVPGAGNPDAGLVLIGEAPGADDAGAADHGGDHPCHFATADLVQIARTRV